MTVTRSRLAPPPRVRVVAEPCACDGDRVCGYHYGQLSPDQRAAARARGGVRDPQHKHRAAWADR